MPTRRMLSLVVVVVSGLLPHTATCFSHYKPSAPAGSVVFNSKRGGFTLLQQHQQQQQGRRRRRDEVSDHDYKTTRSALFSTTSTSNETIGSTNSRNNMLQEKTIKELWDIIKEDTNHRVERGLKSRLKKKEDIINYIEENHITLPKQQQQQQAQIILAEESSEEHEETILLSSKEEEEVLIVEKPTPSTTITTNNNNQEGQTMNINDNRNSNSNVVAVADSALDDHTVKELWQMIRDAGRVEPGLKTLLRRKQDIIRYIQENDILQQQRQQGKGRYSHDDDDDGVDGDNESNNESEEEDTTNISPDVSNSIITSDEEREELVDEDHDDEKEKEEEQMVEKPTSTSSIMMSIDSDIEQLIPSSLARTMVQRNITSLLPIQLKSFQRIYSGDDAVLQAPTGSGKTLAYVLPLLSKKPRGRRKKVVAPSVLVLAPARELARQVGREFDKFSGTTTTAVTVFGGVPIERHVAMLKKGKPRILIGTPGRLRELFREGHFDFSQISTVVLDEADTLLDKADSPDVRAILNDLEEAVGEGVGGDDDAEYQVVLVSATMNQNVLQFARDLEIPSKALIRVRGISESKVPIIGPTNASQQQQKDTSSVAVPQAQPVQHWHMSCKTIVRPSVALDLISILSPLLTIVFVASKAEAESVASLFSSKLGGSVRVLHGDMQQSARSRSIALIREAAREGDSQILVATDVASRGIDLAVDLVIQFGVPRISGKEGTFSTELYTHRTGRTGRVRSDGSTTRDANAIMLYDPAAGEGKLVPHLSEEVNKELGIKMLPKQLPSAAEVVASAYERTKEMVSLGDGEPEDRDLTIYFRQVIETEKGVDTSNSQQLLEYLARAMALLSNVNPSISPFHQYASLLSGSTADRTIRMIGNDKEMLTPPMVTKACKELGSGKLGRVQICADGSAVFDLPKARATRLLAAAASRAGNCDFQMELPLTLPDL